MGLLKKCVRQGAVAVVLLAVAALLVAPASAGASQQNKEASDTAAAKKQPSQAWSVRVKNPDAPVPSVTLKAKDAPLTEVAAELQRQLGVIFLLSPMAKGHLVTVDFKDLPLQSAIRLLTPHVFVDYVLTGGRDIAQPLRPKPLAIYLSGENEKLPPMEAPYSKDASDAAPVMLYEGFVGKTKEEEDEYYRKLAEDLQVSYDSERGKLKVRVRGQSLTMVLREIATQLGIPFQVLSPNVSQSGLTEGGDYDFEGSVEDSVRNLFPESVHLYLRSDLVSGDSWPVRLTLETPASKAKQSSKS